MSQGICVLTGLSNKCSVANVIFHGYSAKKSSAVLLFNITVRWIEIPVKIRLQEKAEQRFLPVYWQLCTATGTFVFKPSMAAAEASVWHL